MIPSLEIKEFFTPGKTLDKAHVILHITEPNAPHERERGVLFALFELTRGTVGLIENCQKIIEYIEERYYSREEKSESVLEHILQAVNREYRTILSQYQTELSCVVGTINDGEIQLSYHGKPTAVVFFHHNNEIATLPVIEEENNAELFFSELISGTIGTRDFFYAATPHTLNYFPLDRIAKLVNDRPVREVANHIQKVLSEIGSDYSFGGLLTQILHIRPNSSKLAPEKIEHLGSEASLNHLANATHETAETLSPPLFGDVKKTLQKIKDSPSRFAHLRSGSSAKSDSTKDHVLIIIGRSMVMAIQSLARICVGIGRSIFNFFFWLYRLIKNRNSRLKEINQARLKLNNCRRTIVGLPTATKVIATSLLLIGLIFLSSLVYLRIYEYQTAAKTKIINLIQAIIDKKDAAEASLAYEDKAKAQILIDEAQALLNQLPNDSNTEKNKQGELNAILLSVRDKLRNEHRVTPELIANLSIVNGENHAEKLTLSDTTLIAFGSNDPSWYFINIATNAVEGKLHESMNGLIEASPTNEGDLIVFRSQTGELGVFDTKTQTLTKKNISFPANDAIISTMEIYNRKLYVIDSINKKIYRHNQTQNGYDQGALWSRSGESRLGGVVSMSIDGDLYALKDNGEVRKWYRGEEQAFNLAAVDPTMDSAEKISVPEDGDEIFILDNKKRRILVFDKNGVFREQIVSDSFKNPTGMTITNKGKTIFILDNGTVYRVSR
ncbi:MAG: hypothetical protein A2821_02585 [Candidatus Magasanikbacteria bacterium RIFCSPHIGHO2_01_FULL_41_23]|uniref:PPM-type phosphatase domain-containing protein n=1 Tax=Candidatus Magasanikbacteria bacterium RIFCSPLOWO2_01_FULL_40_15 TaxID=1798686 RepID=A0A1F6N2Q1_9BACT|nr:MAG: hypothetical protein A2821_02585 [Candidatus Magasanikbacteria bacterium RIFCSPHIGHO2_01_FULL_41_23]OGH66894.1 MAG: hypothetical protein A3C66_02365 [Candidatus Magasanikbacteria bacterium RIFCSPHIGHO2_02_FULL_41_35]OGH74878.1 MAG: hypothetical protein A3F22_04295 [Candidatus Magasanikbacteria bacterium RIFCSPHIGHO2_12_FULL_41_16]OGH78152.1 MAG: hypothetical protein A2983_03710 [Candidatus Magasanikbacteria bacterium RIFCSPLOWO2_01_FULL_40_15]